MKIKIIIIITSYANEHYARCIDNVLHVYYQSPQITPSSYPPPPSPHSFSTRLLLSMRLNYNLCGIVICANPMANIFQLNINIFVSTCSM